MYVVIVCPVHPNWLHVISFPCSNIREGDLTKKNRFKQYHKRIEHTRKGSGGATWPITLVSKYETIGNSIPPSTTQFPTNTITLSIDNTHHYTITLNLTFNSTYLEATGLGVAFDKYISVCLVADVMKAYSMSTDQASDNHLR